MTSDEMAKRIYSDEQIASFKARGIWDTVLHTVGLAYYAGYIDAIERHKPEHPTITQATDEFKAGTVIGYLEKLPEPYGSKAIKNTKPENYNCEAADTVDAIKRAFVWGKSPQGHDYWHRLAKSLEAK